VEGYSMPDKNDKAQIAIRIDGSIVRQFKSCVALRGEKISDVLTRLILSYIQETKTMPIE
jgi:antitoxin component of RelBE/YafQ-DinJ toxin-antitoxin module